MSLPARDEIDPEYRFDLSRIYETASAWDDAHAALRDQLDALEDAANGPLETTADLRDLLELTEACYRRKQRLELYAKLAENVNQGDEAAVNRRNRYEDLESTFETNGAAVRRRLRDTDGTTLDGPVADLDDYQRYAQNIREQARHVRSPEVEETVAALGPARRSPTETIDAVWSDYVPPTVERPDGTTVEIRSENRRKELSHPDRAYRRRVYEAFWDELERFEETLTRAFTAKLATASREAKIRGFESVRDRDLRQRCYPESGLKSRLPERVHDVMVETVRENLGPYHRALELRRDRLGVEDLRPWDLDASLAATDPPEVDYETAKQYVLDALQPLGEEYVARVRSLFDERRIDAFPTRDKADFPAYCQSSAADGPFVLANFRDDLRSTFVLCHELGHAMHVEHHRADTTRYATCPRPVEEVPSTLHVILLAEHLAETGGPFTAAVHDRLLHALAASFYRSTMVSAFTHELAGRIARDETVQADDVRDLHRDLLAEFRAPVDLDADAGRTWLGRGRREPYSSYQYVLGATGAMAARERLRDGTLTADEYREFLRSTGRESSLALFERLGSDVTSPGPYERAAGAFEEYVRTAAEDRSGR